MTKNKLFEMDSRYEEYLKDESRLSGKCASISFPETEIELVEIANGLWEKGIPITVQGARTGISGGSVPMRGHVTSTEKLNKILSSRLDGNRYLIAVQPGVRLCELNYACETGRIAQLGYRFLTDPTETSATFGGMFMSNAKGINAFAHGDTASRVAKIRMLLVDGTFLRIERGQYVFDKNGCNLPNGKRIELSSLSEISCGVKGLYTVGVGTDLIDVFAGSEGMLGIVTEIEMYVDPIAAEQWGVLFFFNNKINALSFSAEIIGQKEYTNHRDVRLAAVEFYHKTSLDVIAAYKNKVTRLRAIPDFPTDAESAVYIELEGKDTDKMELALMSMLHKFVRHGGNEDDTWAGTGAREMEKLKLLRHAAPEAVNAKIDEVRRDCSEITKLCTDFSAPVNKIKETVSLYENGISKSNIEGVIFGHISSNHFHVNLIPKTKMEFERGTELIDNWAKQIVKWGGTVVSENGVGKLKRDLFLKHISKEQLETAKVIKNYFDPELLLNPENML